jgi:hypothetical protein
MMSICRGFTPIWGQQNTITPMVTSLSHHVLLDSSMLGMDLNELEKPNMWDFEIRSLPCDPPAMVADWQGLKERNR